VRERISPRTGRPPGPAGGWRAVISFTGVLVVGIVSVLVPVVLGFLPALPVPGAVLEVIAGIVIGPSVLGWVHIDVAITVLSDLGLGMLLFLAGLEIDVGGLRGPRACWSARST
jgi:Kef-type K+ transport system membrane component KefB